MTDEILKGLLQFRQLPRKAKLLGLLALDDAKPKGARELRVLGRELGLPEMRRWRLAELFSQLAPEVELCRAGWRLKPAGHTYVYGLPQLLRQMEMASGTPAGAPPPKDVRAA